MIYTVTLNPALDLELCVPEIDYDRVLRAADVRADCGGKGFNISRSLNMWRVPNLALGLVGGKTGERMVEELNTLGVQTEFDWTVGETRTNVHIVDIKSRRYIKVNQPGPRVTESDLDRLNDRVRSKAREGDLWVFSGSLPPGAPSNTYSPMISAVQAAGGRALVDADGETLRQACMAQPYLVKPNALEAGELASVKIDSPTDALKATGYFQSFGVQGVLVTLGVEGAVLSLDGEAWWAKPPCIEADIPTGAGDATLAGYVWGLSRGLPAQETLRLAVSSGTASTSLPGTAVASRELIESIAGKVVVENLFSRID